LSTDRLLQLLGDHLYVSLEPESVAVCRVRGVFRKKLIAKDIVECDPHYGQRPWEGAVEALRQSLGALKKDRTKVCVVLSNRLVRYALVPSDAAASAPEEELALARFHFTRIYGERAKAWDLRLSEGTGGTRIASAVDEGLIKALRACFPRADRPRLVSVQPYLAAAFNRWRGKGLGKDGAWLVLLERERACFALASREGWHSVQSVRVDSTDDVLSLLEREGLRAGGKAVRKATIHGARPEPAPGWALSQPEGLRLEGYSPAADSRYAMALCAA
jgi:hypothetical protein